MTKPVKKIKFTGFPDYHDPRCQPYYRWLSDRYELVESDAPDYIIDGGQSFQHIKYDAVKILISSENEVPDFNMYDYAVASCHLDFEDRYLRVPWFAFSPYLSDAINRPSEHEISLAHRKFCSFVVSNMEFGDPMRKRFFEELSKYKRVDSGGRFLNNIGDAVCNKLAFCKNYKFNIAFENSLSSGYITEKIVEAYAAKSVPIYYGSPMSKDDFREDSLIRVKSLDDINRAIEEIIRLDNDDAAYMKKISCPCSNVSSAGEYTNRIGTFLSRVFDQPILKARRLCKYGRQAMMRRHLGYMYMADYLIGQSWPYRIAVKMVGKLRRARM